MSASVTLLLARHGNTFAAGQPAYWVGAHEDMALTPEGEAQATRLGRALAASGRHPSAIRSGPLQRTRRAAALIAAELPAPPAVEIDPTLCELDYGSWAGLTDAEIVARHGQPALDSWRLHARFPEGAGWQPPRAALDTALDGLLTALGDGSHGPLPLLVTSNGILRLLGALLGEADGPTVKTGHVCGVSLPERRVLFWNAVAQPA